MWHLSHPLRAYAGLDDVDPQRGPVEKFVLDFNLCH